MSREDSNQAPSRPGDAALTPRRSSNGKVLLSVAVLMFVILRLPAQDDFQCRNRYDVRWLGGTNWVANTWGEVRFTDDASKFTNWRVGQQLQYNPCPGLTLGVGYTHIEQDGLNVLNGHDEHLDAHRAEAELTPRFQLTDSLRLNWRSRFENRWAEGRGSWNPVFRTRAEFIWAIPEAGPLSEVFASNEFFFDLRNERYSQNRLMPFGLTVTLNGHARLRINYLLESFHLANTWAQQHVLQTHLILTTY